MNLSHQVNEIMKYILYFYLFFFFISCSIKKNIESGIYIDNPKIKDCPSFIELVINSDSSFDYKEGRLYCSGKWSLKKQLFLNSSNDYLRDSLQVNETFNESGNNITFTITDFDNQPFSYGVIYLNRNKTPIQLDTYGKLTLHNNIELSKFQLSYLPARSEIYHLKDPHSNSFTVKTNLMRKSDLFFQIVLKNKKIRIHKNALIIYSKDKRRFKLHKITSALPAQR